MGGAGHRRRRPARVLGGGDADLTIGDLALLSDCRTAALLTLAGDVVWWPGGRFDGASVFTRVLDPEAGHFSIRPTGSCVSRRAYLDGTLVLQTDHDTGAGVLRVTDALAFAPAARGHEIGHASPDALVRVAEALDGDMEVEVELVPRPEYGLAVPRLERERGQVVSIGGSVRLFLADGGVLDPDGGSARGRFTLRAGERRGFVLQRRPGVDGDPPAPMDAEAALADTIAAWRSWTEMHDQFEGPYREAVLLSTRVIQGLTYQPTGAVIAAVSCRESEHVQTVFGATGERLLSEHELGHLAGFGGSRPVRIGNDAWRQRQHDVLGEVLDVALALGDDLELDDFTAAFLCQLVDRAAEQWREPDAGIWERRDDERRHTLSAAMCWVALDRGVQLAGALGEQADRERWARVRDEVRAAVLDEAWHEARGTLVGTMSGEVDAARAAFERAAACANDVGLLAEMADPRTGEALGNTPQALSHVGLIVAANEIARAGKAVAA